MERKEEMVDDRDACSTLHGDFSLCSKESAFDWVRKVDRELSLNRYVPKVVVKVGGGDLVQLHRNIDHHLLIKGCRKALSIVIKILYFELDRHFVNIDLARFLEICCEQGVDGNFSDVNMGRAFGDCVTAC